MSPYHFTQDDRLKLETYKAAGNSNAQIAEARGFHKSSIGRELRRNSSRGRYQGDAAHAVCKTRRQEIERTRKLDYPALRRYVIDRTMDNWSPEQISGRLRKEYAHDPLIQVSHETIYTAASSDERLGSLLIPYWRRSKKKRQKRGLLKGKREIIKGRISIEKRPQQVADRSRVGDLEGDTVVGSGQSGNILTLVDRKSLYLIAGLCPSKHSDVVAQTVIDLLRTLGSYRFHTITFDNGTEFTEHTKISLSLSVEVFFARPYHSNDRARNENTNGLLRQYFPKHSRFDKIIYAHLQRAVHELNNRPRKTLDYRTPAEVFNQERVAFRV